MAKTGSNQKALDELAKKYSLNPKVEKKDSQDSREEQERLEEYAEALLQASYQKNIPLIKLEELQSEAQKQGSFF